MAWVIDTSIVIDIFEADPQFGKTSAVCLKKHLAAGLALCPISYVELAPLASGDEALLQAFLQQAGLDWLGPWTWADTVKGFELWNAHVAQKRRRLVPKRPIADILIGAYAYRFDGLITRNAAEFGRLCPGLRIVEP